MFLTVKDLKKSYGSTSNKVEVLKGINFEVEKGEICVLLGPSGSGKSTLLNIIGGIDDADLGYVSIDSEKTKDMKEKELTRYRRKHLGYVFQMYNLIPNLNVKENIEVGAYLSDSPLDINELLNTLGLYEHRHKLPNQLSGGQQQRTAIGRAIVKNPDILSYVGHSGICTVVIGFAAETDNLAENARKKLDCKAADMIVVNPASAIGSAQNQASFVTKDGIVVKGRSSKAELAEEIIETLADLLKKKEIETYETSN